MVFSKRKASLRHLLTLIYILTVVLVIALLIRASQSDEPPFSLSHASAEGDQEAVVLSLYGEAFHTGIRGVFAKSLVNEEALAWHQLAGIPSTAIDVKNDLALVACSENKLVSIGLHDGQSPELLSSIDLPDTIRQIKIVGDLALLGLQLHAGLFLVDLKDPGALNLVRNYPLSGFVTSMVVDRSVVYFTEIYKGVGRIDLSLENPVPEMLVSLNSPWRMTLQANRLAVGTIKDGVLLFNVAQDGQLIKVGSLDYLENVRGVAFVDDSLAVALANDALHVFNLSAWPVLKDPAQLMLPGSPIQMERVPGRASLAVSLIAGGVALIDFSQPKVPVLSGHLKRPRILFGMKLQSEKVFGVSLDGIKAFSLDKISGGEYSLLATEATIGQDHYKLQSWNGHIYGHRDNHLVDFGEKEATQSHPFNRFMTVVEKHGVSLFEQRENGQIKRVGSLIKMVGAKEARFQDGHLYVVHQDGLRILAGTRPEELVAIADLKLSGTPTEFKFLDPGYLLVTTRDNGVLVVDVNNPQQPVQVASLIPPQHLRSPNVIRDVLVDGQRAYISQGAGGVHVVDMSSPSQPELLQIIDTPGHAQRMALYDNLLLVADHGNGLFMIDVMDRNGALAVGSLPTPLRIDQIAVVKDGVIVSSHPGGTMKLPLPRRMKNLEIVNQGEISVDVEKVGKGEYAYLYDERTFEKVKVESQ